MIRLGNFLGVIGTSLSSLTLSSARVSSPLPEQETQPAGFRDSDFSSGSPRDGLLDLERTDEAQVSRFLLNRASTWNFRRLALVDRRSLQEDEWQQVLYAASLGDIFAAVQETKKSDAELKKALRGMGYDRDTISFARDYVRERAKMVAESLNLSDRGERIRLATEFFEIALHARQEVGVCLFLARRLADLSGLDWRALVRERNERASGYERELIGWVREQGGTVPFDQFFEHAMFNPQAGTYTGKTAHHLICPAAAESPDAFFTTSATDPVLALSLLSQARYLWQRAGSPSRFDLVEMGAGMGNLAEAVLQAIEDLPEGDAFRTAARYAIVEKSPALSLIQGERLKRFGGRARVMCRSALGGGLPRIPAGMFFSNELVDMFPPRKLVNAGGQLREVSITHRGGLFQEVLGPVRDSTREFLAGRGIQLNLGETYYIQPDIDPWIASLAEALGEGGVVTIDYGGTRERLRKVSHEFGASMFRGYIPRSDAKAGFRLVSLHSYWNSPTGVARPKDMTVDVDFTTLEEAAARAPGLRVAGYMSQKEFCLLMGGQPPQLKGFDNFRVSLLEKYPA